MERKRKGVVLSLIGIFCNLLLSVGKIAAGLLTGIFSIAADGFNNLSDCGSGIASMISFVISAKPADREHPYGHRRAETIASMIMGVLIVFLAAELVEKSVEKILHLETIAVPLYVYWILGISIAVKMGMFLLNRFYAKQLNSDVLRAAGTDSLCDCAATLSVILGAVLLQFGIAADGYIGICVALFIAWQGLRILSDASSQLLGRAPDPNLVLKIKTMILETEGILGLHDLFLFNYGKDVCYATVHLEMDARVPSMEAHRVLDSIEKRVLRETNVVLTAHLDPVDLENSEELELEFALKREANKITNVEIHDFRLDSQKGEVSFEAGVPYSCVLKDKELEALLIAIVRERCPYTPIVKIERE